jgi:hypothetical protein
MCYAIWHSSVDVTLSEAKSLGFITRKILRFAQNDS